ncbi:MAG TPA: hypothetical protein VGX70_14320 [Gemmataceae bacterium]|jgi:hypothetical protein|nr:hypothetical protein [Gemmataceae bacterium]
MKRIVVLAGMFCLLAGLIGCSSNLGEALLNADIDVMNKAAAQLRSVKDRVNEAVQKAAKDNKSLTDTDLKPAVEAAKALKEIGNALQKLKEKTDTLKDSTTPEEREELAKRFSGRMQTATVDLIKAQQELDQAIRKAEGARSERDAVVTLKNTLREAEGEFEVLAKQQ